MSNVDIAVSCFKEGYACSQAVLPSFSEQLGLDRETSLRISSGFGGGMGRMADTCGAVTGAYMVMGLKYGGTPEGKEKAYETVREVASKFKSRNNGCVRCKKLLGCDISTPEGLKAARDQDIFSTICPKFVKDAVEIVEEILRQ